MNAACIVVSCLAKFGTMLILKNIFFCWHLRSNAAVKGRHLVKHLCLDLNVEDYIWNILNMCLSVREWEREGVPLESHGQSSFLYLHRNWLNAYLIQTCRRKKTALLALGRPHISCRKKHKCSLIRSIKRTLYKIKFYKLNKALKYFIKQFACMYYVTFLWDRGVILLRLGITKIYSLAER